MRVLIAPDSFGGTLSPVEAAQAMADGWLDARPDDEVHVLPLSDGGEGLLDAIVHSSGDGRRTHMTAHSVEVVGPRGLPVRARHLVVDAGATAIVESAGICGLALLAPGQRDPRLTTTWGVGQLLGMIAEHGGRRVLLGLGGTATVDGGAGALSGLGWRVTVGDGSGLKIGGEDLPRVAGVAPGWVPAAMQDVGVELLADVGTTLLDAPRVFGPQKGADEATVSHLEAGLRAWADVVERAFAVPGLRDEPGTGAAGGLGFALMAAHGATLVSGVEAVADLVGLAAAVSGADLVVTGEGRLDATSLAGKVVGHVLAVASDAGVPVAGIAGQVQPGPHEKGFSDLVAASPEGPGPTAEGDVRGHGHRFCPVLRVTPDHFMDSCAQR